jgi:hypothetical protein
MKKIFLALSLATMTVPMPTYASWENVLGIAVGVLGGIHDCQCRQVAGDIDCILGDVIHETHYGARKFAYEDEPLVYDIESTLRNIQYEWAPCITYHARTCFVSASQLQAVHNALRSVFDAVRHCRPVSCRCYHYELSNIRRILYDVEHMMRDVSYAPCSCQCDFLWRLTKDFGEVARIVRRI